MKNIINFIKDMSIITFGLGVLLFIYYKFIMERLPRAFIDMTEYQKICIILTTIGIGTSLVIQIRNIYRNKEKRGIFEKIKSLGVYLQNKIYTVFEEMYHLLLMLIDKYIIYPYTLLIKMTRFFVKSHSLLSNGIIIITMEMLPPIGFHIALIIDILYLKTFYYSYKFIALFLIPYLTKILMLLLVDFYTNYYAYTKSMVEIREETINGNLTTIVSFKDEFQDCGYDINFFVNQHLLILAQIPIILKEYNNARITVLKLPYFNILLTSIKLLLFIYILYTLDLTFIYNK